MSRVITFSRRYPSYHPEKGERTNFPEKLVKSLMELGYSSEDFDELDYWDESLYESCRPKHHTIRAGHRFKEGDLFSARVWSGRPYQSTQITLVDNVNIVKTWDFEIQVKKFGQCVINLNKERIPADTLGIIAMHDGLSFTDFLHWFRYPDRNFEGQIICWNPNIEYP